MRLPERTDAKVARAGTRVVPAVVREAIVGQSVIDSALCLASCMTQVTSVYSRRMRLRRKARIPQFAALAAVLAVLAVLATGTSHAAAPATLDIGTATGPLTHVYISNDLSCQAAHLGDTAYEFYEPSEVAADCATFLAAGGHLYAPDFSQHSNTATGDLNGGAGYTAYTSVSQTPVSGSGTTASPFTVTTTVALGSSGLTIAQTDSYVKGNEFYATSIVVRNTSAAAVTATLFHAGDCYLPVSYTHLTLPTILRV